MACSDRGFLIWMTGLSGAGKSTLARALSEELARCGRHAEVLDGDVIRENLSKGLGFSKEDRDTNIRRIGFVAGLLSKHGVPVIAAAISPYRLIRDEIRASAHNFIETYVDAPLAVCERRDPKGLYRKARAGEIKQFTGIDDPYEAPASPEIRLDTAAWDVETCTKTLLAYLDDRDLV